MFFNSQENVSCLNTTLIFLMFAHNHGQLGQYLQVRRHPFFLGYYLFSNFLQLYQPRNLHRRTYIFRQQPVKDSYFLHFTIHILVMGKCEFNKDMHKLYIYTSCIFSYRLFYFLSYFCQNGVLNFSLKILVIQVLLCGFLLQRRIMVCL